jgi:hypothetical protein
MIVNTMMVAGIDEERKKVICSSNAGNKETEQGLRP